MTKSLWKLPDLWTHRTRPQVLGNHRTVSPKLPQGLILLMTKDQDRKR